MRRLAALGLLCALAALVALAQVSVNGGVPGSGASSGGASFWNGTVAPSSIVGANGDFYLNTSTYCLYGPKATGAWPVSCVSLVGQSGAPGPPLGYIAENTANRGAPGGYAPLNSSAQIPLTNLPIIPYTQISGVELALGFTPLSPANNLGDLSNAAAARSNLGLVIGTNVEPHSALLDGFAGLAGTGIVAVSGSSASSGNLSGDVTTNGLAATVNSVGGSTAVNLHNAEVLANAATANDTNSTIVMRDHSGNINATQVYAGGVAVENTANKGAANGYAPLDGSGLLPAANLPASSVTNTTIGNGTLPASFTGVSTSGAGAGAFMMTAGAAQTPPANTVGLQAPPSVPISFNCTWWGVPTLGLVHATATAPCILSSTPVTLVDTDNTIAGTASPAFSGIPTAPTQAAGDASTALATDAFVGAAVANGTPYTAPFTGAVAQTQKAKNAQVVNVLDFGADPSGVADSYPAFTAALAASNNVQIPCGTFIFSAVLPVSTTNAHLIGSGDCTILSPPNDNTSLIFLGGNSVGVKVSDFRINGQSTSTSESHSHYAALIITDYSNPPSYFEVDHIHFTGATSLLGWVKALDVSGATYGHIHHNILNNGFGTQYATGILLGDATSQGAAHNLVDNNQLISPGQVKLGIAVRASTAYGFGGCCNIISNNKVNMGTGAGSAGGAGVIVYASVPFTGSVRQSVLPQRQYRRDPDHRQRDLGRHRKLQRGAGGRHPDRRPDHQHPDREQLHPQQLSAGTDD